MTDVPEMPSWGWVLRTHEGQIDDVTGRSEVAGIRVDVRICGNVWGASLWTSHVCGVAHVCEQCELREIK